MRDTPLDYVPTREKNLGDRMDEGASLEDGLAGRTKVQKRGARYRAYRDNSGNEVQGKQWEGSFEPRGDNVNGD